MTSPRFNINAIVRSYTPPSDKQVRAIRKHLKKEGFILSPSVMAFIGIGGTISSAYSAEMETIFCQRSKPAEHIISHITAWGINNETYTAYDPFAKDSRDIEEADIVQLLDVLFAIPNRKILVTCGTYMLPRITEILMRTIGRHLPKIIAVTGSTLPSGFMTSDAPLNIMSAVTVINYAQKNSAPGSSKVFAVYHGIVFYTLKDVRAMTLHPADSHERLIYYPLSRVPIR